MQSKIARAVDLIPAVIPHLTEKALRLAMKDYNYYTYALTNLARMLYQGIIDDEFGLMMEALIGQQLTEAWHQALEEYGFMPSEMTDEMKDILAEMIQNEYQHIDSLYSYVRDLAMREEPFDKVMHRVRLWANRYTDVVNRASMVLMSGLGERLQWVLGPTEEHCYTCNTLNGVVAFASEWETLGVRPQNPPNAMLECGGWNCGCYLTHTYRRRSPRAFDTILNTVMQHQI